MTDANIGSIQKWLNFTYRSVKGFVTAPEDSRTGWPTVNSLILALQHELGIAVLSANIGPTTFSKLTSKGPVGSKESNKNIIRILQGAMFCKGYHGGNTNGVWNAVMERSISKFALDCGLASADSVSATLFRALLNMDGSVLMSGGEGRIREAQQWMNKTYSDRLWYELIPTDGRFSRNVQKAFVKCLQVELGIPDAQLTGTIGPATREKLRYRSIQQTGTPERWWRLFSAACCFNGPVPLANGQLLRPLFSGAYTSSAESYANAFRNFARLPTTAVGIIADWMTWAELLVSTGDENRPVTACDASEPLTPKRAKTLYAQGYRTIGRYLQNFRSKEGRNKELQPGEVDTIFKAGLTLFPIWQMRGDDPKFFTGAAGAEDATRATEAMTIRSLAKDSVIYFAVDCDATDDQITSHILPYFRSVVSTLKSSSSPYRAGVYGTRNVCTRLANEGSAVASFVSGMSTGYSGNLGFSLPPNWAFNQIQTIIFPGEPTSSTIQLDRVASRGEIDLGISLTSSTRPSSPSFQAAVEWCFQLNNASRDFGLAADFRTSAKYISMAMRAPVYTDPDGGFHIFLPGDAAWLEFQKGKYPRESRNELYAVGPNGDGGPNGTPSYIDVASGYGVQLDHLMAVASATIEYGIPSTETPNGTDFGGWAGDVITLYCAWRMNYTRFETGREYALNELGKPGFINSFGMDDLIADIDGYAIGSRVLKGEHITTAFLSLSQVKSNAARVNTFLESRFEAKRDAVFSTVRSALVGSFTDGIANAFREALFVTKLKAGYFFDKRPGEIDSRELDSFCHGVVEKLFSIAGRTG